jgi:protein-arginine kinase activator protein McsA
MRGGETVMKRRLISVGIVAGFLLSILMVTGAFAQKDVVTFDVPYGKVTFPHKKHVDMKLDCMKCHHTWKKGETSGKLCVDCHKDKAEGKALSAKDAFHKDCKGCHDEAKKANKPAGPTGCTQCHKKEPAKK